MHGKFLILPLLREYTRAVRKIIGYVFENFTLDSLSLSLSLVCLTEAKVRKVLLGARKHTVYILHSYCSLYRSFLFVLVSKLFLFRHGEYIYMKNKMERENTEGKSGKSWEKMRWAKIEKKKKNQSLGI